MTFKVPAGVAVAVCLACSTVLAGPASGVVRYVDDSAVGANDGTSWADAFTDFQSALTAAQAGDWIWVAAGTYRPSVRTNPADPRTATFQMINNVEIYGGFAGNEDPATFDLDDRDFVANETILSGDLNGDDVKIGDPADLFDEPTRAENSYHVFYHPEGIALDATAVLDGVTIYGGNADGDTPHDDGGGMCNPYCGPMLTNCVFIRNSAVSAGGGLHNGDTGNTTLANCAFSQNWANNGGGMYNNGDSSLADCTFSGNSTWSRGGGLLSSGGGNANLTDCTFSQNTATWGGGFVNCGNSSLTHCTFSQNSATYSGGGMGSLCGSPTLTKCLFYGNSGWTFGGGLSNTTGGSPVVTDCAFVGNFATYGGGMGNRYGAPSLTNCTFSANSAQYGSAMYNQDNGSPTLTNCILWGDVALSSAGEVYSESSTPAFYYCNIAGSGGSSGWDSAIGVDGGGNIDADPQFVRDPHAGPDGSWNGVNDDYGDLRLNCASPCLDAGTNNTDPPLPATDLDGEPRIIDGLVDMGAYEGEKKSFIIQPQPVYVSEGGAADFTVRPVCDPAGTVMVSVTYESGDTDIIVESGSELVFDSSNYTTPQLVTLAANQDVDLVEGTTQFRIEAADGASGVVTAREVEDDIGPIVFVSAGASGSGSGTSWADAFRDLQTALDVATSLNSVDQLWVAEGTYQPTVKTRGIDPRGAAFRLVNGVAVYGGFAGAEDPLTFDLTDRDFVANETILSGDYISFHVFFHFADINLDSTAVLDGVTITRGNASFIRGGGGMYNFNCSPTLANCRFTDNVARYAGNESSTYGGGMYNYYSHPTLINCAFSANEAPGYSSYDGDVGGGGGMANVYSNPTLTNCVFSGNSAAPYGEGGAIFNSFSSPALTNCTLGGNRTDNVGGEMCNRDSSNPTLTNCIVWGENSAVINSSSLPVFSYCDVSGSGGSANWNTAIGVDGGGNIDADPLFARMPSIGPDEKWGTADDDYGNLRVVLGSPCLDAGNSGAIPADTWDLDGDGDTTEPAPFDLDGNSRILGAAVDLGAYEGINTVLHADLNHSGDIDNEDVTIFQACMSGSNVTADANCRIADLDSDGDVDQSDFGILQGCLSGTGVAADPGCVD